MSDLSAFELPTDPEDINKIKAQIELIVAEKRLIKDRQIVIKEIQTDLKEGFDMPPGLINKLVKAQDDADYVEMTAEFSVFELVRETIMGDGGLPDDRDVAA